MNDAVYAVLSARTGRREGRVFSTRSVRNAFEKAVSEAKLEDFRFHGLRHIAASHLVMRGASLADVCAVLGHSDIKMTMRYAHLSPEHLRSAVARLDGLAAAPKAAGLAHGQRKVVESTSLDSQVLETPG
jgi:integrase